MYSNNKTIVILSCLTTYLLSPLTYLSYTICRYDTSCPPLQGVGVPSYVRNSSFFFS